jgi:hypothetical protein
MTSNPSVDSTRRSGSLMRSSSSTKRIVATP